MQNIARRALDRIYSAEIFVACSAFALVAAALISDIVAR